MTEKQFDEFIVQHDLFYSDGMINIILKDGSTHNAVWITALPPLEKSVKGKFDGLPAGNELFYDFDSKKYSVWNCGNIEKTNCVQQEYLQSPIRKILKSK